MHLCNYVIQNFPGELRLVVKPVALLFETLMKPPDLLNSYVQKKWKIDFYLEECNPNTWQEADHDPNP